MTVPSGPSIPIARPLLGEREAAAAAQAVLSGWVTQGPAVAAFEQAFAAYVGAPHACAVSSCTTALHLALAALDIGDGDEVITVSHSFIATANAVRMARAEPVFIDIDPVTFNIDPALVEAAITPRTRAILCVHQLGMPCAVEGLREIAARRGLRLIEDAACAIGSEVRVGGTWQHVGRPIGDVVCFSFHPRKVITTGDGGMLTTTDAALDARFRLLRQHGMNVSDLDRHLVKRVVRESYLEVGFNYRMTDIQAAIGLVQLSRLGEILPRRRQIAALYRKALAPLTKWMRAPFEPETARSNWQSYCVMLAETIDRDGLMETLLQQGIALRPAVMCSHREPAYADRPLRFALPHSEYVRDHGVIVPLFPQLEDSDVTRVVDALAQACRSAA